MKDYARYTGMAFELLVLILLMVYIGKKMDSWLELKKPVMLVVLVSFGVIGYMVKIYYQTSKNREDEK